MDALTHSGKRNILSIGGIYIYICIYVLIQCVKSIITSLTMTLTSNSLHTLLIFDPLLLLYNFFFSIYLYHITYYMTHIHMTITLGIITLGPTITLRYLRC